MFFLSFGIQIGIEAGIDIRLWNDVLVYLSQHKSKQIFNHISNVTYAETYTTGQTYILNGLAMFSKLHVLKPFNAVYWVSNQKKFRTLRPRWWSS